MVSRRKILSRSRDDLNLDQTFSPQEEEEDVWYQKDKLYKEHIQEVLDKWTQIDDEIWAKVIVFERNRRVAKAYARAPVLTINGSDDGFDGMRIGLCGFDNPMRDPKTEELKRIIGQGVKIKMDDAGNILVRRYAKSNVYVKSTASNPNEETSIGAEILKLPNQALESEKIVKLFDMKKFQSNVNRELRRAYPDRRRLETQCLSAVAFVKSENDILECPIWVLIVNVVAMDMLKSKLPPVQRPIVDIKNRPRIPIPDEDPYSVAGNGSGGSSGSSGFGSGHQQTSNGGNGSSLISNGMGGGGANNGNMSMSNGIHLTNGTGHVAATREQLLLQTQQLAHKRSEKPPKLPPRDNNYAHDIIPKPDYDDIDIESRIKLSRGKSDKGKDNKKYDDPYYCGLRARVPNFVKTSKSKDQRDHAAVINGNGNSSSIISNNNNNSNHISNNNMNTLQQKKTSMILNHHNSSSAMHSLGGPVAPSHMHPHYMQHQMAAASQHKQHQIWQTRSYESGIGIYNQKSSINPTYNYQQQQQKQQSQHQKQKHTTGTHNFMHDHHQHNQHHYHHQHHHQQLQQQQQQPQSLPADLTLATQKSTAQASAEYQQRPTNGHGRIKQDCNNSALQQQQQLNHHQHHRHHRRNCLKRHMQGPEGIFFPPPPPLTHYYDDLEEVSLRQSATRRLSTHRRMSHAQAPSTSKTDGTNCNCVSCYALAPLCGAVPPPRPERSLSQQQLKQHQRLSGGLAARHAGVVKWCSESDISVLDLVNEDETTNDEDADSESYGGGYYNNNNHSNGNMDDNNVNSQYEYEYDDFDMDMDFDMTVDAPTNYMRQLRQLEQQHQQQNHRQAAAAQRQPLRRSQSNSQSSARLHKNYQPSHNSEGTDFYVDRAHLRQLQSPAPPLLPSKQVNSGGNKLPGAALLSARSKSQSTESFFEQPTEEGSLYMYGGRKRIVKAPSTTNIYDRIRNTLHPNIAYTGGKFNLNNVNTKTTNNNNSNSDINSNSNNTNNKLNNSKRFDGNNKKTKASSSQAIEKPPLLPPPSWRNKHKKNSIDNNNNIDINNNNSNSNSNGCNNSLVMVAAKTKAAKTDKKQQYDITKRQLKNSSNITSNNSDNYKNISINKNEPKTTAAAITTTMTTNTKMTASTAAITTAAATATSAITAAATIAPPSPTITNNKNNNQNQQQQQSQNQNQIQPRIGRTTSRLDISDMESIYDSEHVESPYNHIYGRHLPLPTRGYVPAPRMFIGEWD